MKSLISWFQNLSSKLFPGPRASIVRFIKKAGVEFSVLKIEKTGYTGDNKLFKQLQIALSEGKEIWMCVGEMGFRFMQREEVIVGIKEALVKNNASVNIVHGPRIDPGTEAIYKIAETAEVKFFELPKYPPDHFVYISKNDGTATLLEESPHPEVVRVEDKSGEYVEFYQGKHRAFYLINHVSNIGKLRLQQAKFRAAKGTLTNTPNRDFSGRKYPLGRIFLSLITWFSFRTFITQPISVILSSADFSTGLVVESLIRFVTPNEIKTIAKFQRSNTKRLTRHQFLGLGLMLLPILFIGGSFFALPVLTELASTAVEYSSHLGLLALLAIGSIISIWVNLIALRVLAKAAQESNFPITFMGVTFGTVLVIALVLLSFSILKGLVIGYFTYF